MGYALFYARTANNKIASYRGVVYKENTDLMVAMTYVYFRRYFY